MERAYILEFSPILTPESFPDELFTSNPSPAQVKPNIFLSLAEVRRTVIEQTERCYLKELLAANNGRIKESAETAGISTRQLHKLMKKHGVRKEEFKAPVGLSNILEL